ncbi:PREDICTED: uncharacterized protein LOC105557984 [Vollenhovia emeryi]|uniref:uncharacterized protein LOC105557984 n=1 Tax=Vollenhovia emeryi TaxID=411798 RepID=UPI0005F4B00F|nr:PREDICTED: uncharacterized protein LOC105557984 [Vollenhovia emeryi]
MEWSQDKVIDLINVYKEKSILWSATNPHHFNRLKKKDAWEEIARDTGISVEHCKKKMEYLLSALRREKSKMKKSMGTGKGKYLINMFRSYAFGTLSVVLFGEPNFFNFIFIFSQMENDTINCEETEQENEEAVDSGLNVQENTKPTSALSQTPPPSVIPRKRKATMEDRRLDKAFQILETSSQVMQDDCQHFGNLIAAKLRKLSEDERTYLESDIMGLFVKASRGFYNLPSTCNYFLRQHMQPATHQTSHFEPETSRLSSQHSPYTTTSFEPVLK